MDNWLCCFKYCLIPASKRKKNKIDLKKKVAIVTGGAQGFGLDITKRFLKSGAKVIVWDNDENELKKIVKKIKNKNLYKQMVDVTDPENVEDAVSKITKNMKIDILVNSAGTVSYTHLTLPTIYSV